eukprot:gnl/MRDRNA2_/MRDRNA2_81517_c0_seq2.p1 gnl/MRDRNA2_/MRDRNA2_81517_c0~~gnl/MRDRNA2_/MRDRNA2_81517_c0_seq2.p1  ORF type:complete len:308 (-),score=128.31 gnl/MRDRNA2_/MRDRNA2_81517_c0_seq2:237-1067(-)
MSAGYAAEGGEVRVTKSIDDVRAAEGMKLFEEANAAVVEYDLAAAQKHVDECEAVIKAMEEEVKLLTGKENKKAQTDKKKAISAAKNDPKYIDATKVVKGLEPKNGNFVKSKTEAKKPEKKEEAKPVAEAKKEEPKKDDKKAKKQESAGISKEERQELEDLKNKIVARKTELKAQGMSGGQQNKDPEVATMVARMNELKEKESPGSTQKAGKDAGGSKKKGSLTSDEQKEMDGLKQEIEVYREKLTKEFGYSKKEITADPDMQDMQAKLKAFEKRA